MDGDQPADAVPAEAMRMPPCHRDEEAKAQDKVSDSGSETGAATDAQVRPNAVIVAT